MAAENVDIVEKYRTVTQGVQEDNLHQMLKKGALEKSVPKKADDDQGSWT